MTIFRTRSVKWKCFGVLWRIFLVICISFPEDGKLRYQLLFAKLRVYISLHSKFQLSFCNYITLLSKNYIISYLIFLNRETKVKSNNNSPRKESLKIPMQIYISFVYKYLQTSRKIVQAKLIDITCFLLKKVLKYLTHTTCSQPNISFTYIT